MAGESPKNLEDTEDNSLEQPNTVIEPSGGLTSPQPADASPVISATDTKSLTVLGHLKHFWSRFNIYLLGLIIILIIAVGIVVVLFLKNNSNNKKASSTSVQNLTQAQLAQIANNNASVGNSSQVLNIGSSAIFSGQVLARQDLDVAGQMKVGNVITAGGITISGSSILQQTQVSQLAVAGTGTFQGAVVLGQSLTVNGAATFGGAVNISQLTLQTLQISGDLILNHHIQAGGNNLSHSSGNALGIGGSASVSGSDIAGSININTGSSPSAGCFITVNFAAAFHNTPRIIVTPIGSAAGGIPYYVNRTTTSFSVCTVSSPPAGQSFGFDYIAFD